VTLTVLFNPFIMQPPLSQTVATNGTVTLSVSVTNNATLPLGYRWRRNGVFLPNAFFTLNQYTSYLVITNVQAPLTNYAVTVTNLALPAGITTASAFLTILADSDGDGIPDQWENQFGLLQGDASDRDGDLDGDLMSNYDEYIAGTNPTNNLSYLKIDTLTLGGGATLTFGAISNRTYTLQFTEGVGTGQWSRLADVLARTNNRVETIVDPNYSTNRFYRVATPRVP
jgi:hypothetical protein